MLSKDNTVTVPVCAFAKRAGALMTQSDAKCLLNSVPVCDKVTLDFDGIKKIDPTFAHEIFYNFNLSQPNIELDAVNLNQEVKQEVRKALASLCDFH